MAKKLKEFVFKGKNARGKYPLDQWFDGSIWQLERGQDFTVQTQNMRGVLSAAAKSRGMCLRTRILSDTQLVVQAFKNEQ